MLEKTSRKQLTAKVQNQDGWDILEVWHRYEKIAMHFNDLLIRLRIQALAGVAALSTLVTVLTKTDLVTWSISAMIFLAIWLSWIAIWILDLKYYNLLLRGSVRALIDLEELSKTSRRVYSINMSTMIEKAVAGTIQYPPRNICERFNLTVGIRSFYIIVFGALTFAMLFSFYRCYPCIL